MRRAAVLLLCVGLALAVWGLTPQRAAAESAAALAPAASPSPGFVPWVPSESWAGGRQYDPRLERTVEFWGAGMPLREVFAGVKEQRGVEIGFWPPGDVNERICVTLYLNPEQPPTLRELMAQVSWVTDCGFAYSDTGGSKSYRLLSTTIGDGAIERLHEWADGVQNERGRRRLEVEKEIRDRAVARLAALREALTVPEDEVIERYQGVDDAVLLAMLDPARRAWSRFLLTLSDDDLEELQPRTGITREWSEWTPEQQAVLRDAMTPCLQAWAESGMRYGDEAGRWDDWEWVTGHVSDVDIKFESGGFWGLVWVPDPGGGGAEGIEMSHVQLAGDHRDGHTETMYPESRIELRRLLGEEISQEDADEIVSEFYGARDRRERQEELKQQLARHHRLGQENEVLLAALPMPVERDRPYALWQLQEVVADRSGLHIVSDCLWQPERSLEPVLQMLYPDWTGELTALAVLRAATLPSGREFGPGTAYFSDGGVSWEWGDAGQFLRFRDHYRVVGRQVFLPEDTIGILNGWVDAGLPDEPAPDANEQIVVPLAPRECGRVLVRLTGPQRQYGWYLLYGDPADVRNAYRHAFRERLHSVLGWDLHPYLLAARLSDQQWQQLQSRGLTWGVDVVMEPDVHGRYPMLGGQPAYKKGDVLRLGDAGPGQSLRGKGQTGVTSFKRFWVEREGWGDRAHPPWENSLPMGVTVRPKSRERLVAARDRAGGE